jgi:hypothetical protein
MITADDDSPRSANYWRHGRDLEPLAYASTEQVDYVQSHPDVREHVRRYEEADDAHAAALDDPDTDLDAAYDAAQWAQARMHAAQFAVMVDMGLTPTMRDGTAYDPRATYTAGTPGQASATDELGSRSSRAAAPPAISHPASPAFDATTPGPYSSPPTPQQHLRARYNLPETASAATYSGPTFSTREAAELSELPRRARELRAAEIVSQRPRRK